MKRRLLCALLACTMAATTVLGTGSLTVRADEVKVNYALGGIASASRSPIDYWGPDKLNDGIVNRYTPNKRDQSRWSSETGAPAWVKLDLTEIRKFDEIKIAWENDKTRSFKIEMSNDDETYETIYTSEDKEEGHPMDMTIPLEREKFGRYVKITVNSLIDGAYPSVSIYEVEINGKKTVEDGVKEFRANYALDCDASASHAPISYWGPDKLTDGIINRNASKPDQSRWSSEAGAPAWVNIINLRISAAHLNHFIKCLFIAEHVKRKNAHILPLKGVWAF
ncbi:MAG: discoidin domain-containing protein [Lachnospiraceae bacterium]|nr:discoidin domain-containing protein [Lachnospiraceae bacterium]